MVATGEERITSSDRRLMKDQKDGWLVQIRKVHVYSVFQLRQRELGQR